MTRFRRTYFYAPTLAALSVFAMASPASAASDQVNTVFNNAPATVSVSKCKSAASYSQRLLEFRSVMSTVAGASKMQMRIVLYRRYSEQRKFRVVSPGNVPNGASPEWYESTDTNATTYIHTFPVVPVETRAQYRIKVFYRWRDANNNIVATAKRVSAVCNQTRKLPDLTIADIKQYPASGNATTPSGQHAAEYVVTVKNAGRSSAGLFDITGSVDGTALTDITVQPMLSVLPRSPDYVLAGASIDLTLFGQTCAANLTVTVNGSKMVRESNYANNSMSKAC